MHCHVETREFAGKPTVMFFCGDGPRKRFCRFCGARSTALCDWPKIRREPVRVAAVKPGDEIFLFHSGREIVLVENVDARPFDGAVTLAVSSNDRVREQTLPAFRDVYRAVHGTCDAPVCFRHLRHVAPDRDYCMRHWRAWEDVA